MTMNLIISQQRVGGLEKACSNVIARSMNVKGSITGGIAGTGGAAADNANAFYLFQEIPSKNWLTTQLKVVAKHQSLPISGLQLFEQLFGSLAPTTVIRLPAH